MYPQADTTFLVVQFLSHIINFLDSTGVVGQEEYTPPPPPPPKKKENRRYNSLQSLVFSEILYTTIPFCHYRGMGIFRKKKK